MNTHTAKHFVLQLGSLITLYLSLAFFLVLSFGLINLLFPDGLENLWQIESAASSIRFGFAMVIVFLPTYLTLTHYVNKQRRVSDNQDYAGLTKFLIYLSLLVAGLVLLGNLVAVIVWFLEGELTSRFLLKSLIVLVTIGGAVFYYIKDVQGYWLANEKQSLAYAATATVLILSVLVVAVIHIPNPTTVREMKADSEMVSALQNIMWQVQDYHNENGKLPTTIDDTYGEFDRLPNTVDLADYTYSVESETEYQLCTTFNHDSNELDNQYRSLSQAEDAAYWKNNTWDFRAGAWCFEREVIVEE